MMKSSRKFTSEFKGGFQIMTNDARREEGVKLPKI